MTPKDFYTALIKEQQDVKPSKMFGCDCLKTPNGKAAAMFWHDWLVVKLDEEDTASALKISGVKGFEPMEGRPMNGWVQMPYSAKKYWAVYLKKSIGLVKEIPTKPPKKKTK